MLAMFHHSVVKLLHLFLCLYSHDKQETEEVVQLQEGRLTCLENVCMCRYLSSF